MAGQRIELTNYSMFAETPIYEVGGEIVLGLMRDVVVPDNSDVLYNVPPGGTHRLDLISNEHYGTPHLWWVIARVNNLIDPLVGVVSGAIIRVPTRARLASEGILNV